MNSLRPAHTLREYVGEKVNPSGSDCRIPPEHAFQLDLIGVQLFILSVAAASGWRAGGGGGQDIDILSRVNLEKSR